MAGQVSKAVERVADGKAGRLAIRDAIEKQESEFARALPEHVDVQRFIRAALTALNATPKLAACTRESWLLALMESAQLGLEPNGVRGQAYLIPRWNGRTKTNEVSMQLGYRGLIDLAARAGITVQVDEICDGDEYDYQLGTAPKLFHKPTLKGRGKAFAYYAIAHFIDGRPPQFVIMGQGEIDAHRDKFRSSDKGPWDEHPEAMARKTVIRQLLNYLPSSIELRQQLAIEANSSDVPNVSYMPPQLPELDVPDDVDAATGEIIDVDLVDDDPSIALFAAGDPS